MQDREYKQHAPEMKDLQISSPTAPRAKGRWTVILAWIVSRLHENLLSYKRLKSN